MAMMWLVISVQLVLGVAKQNRARQNAFERILSLDAAAESQRLKEVAGSRAVGRHVRAVQAIGNADALKAVLNGIAARNRESGRRLVVLLQKSD